MYTKIVGLLGVTLLCFYVNSNGQEQGKRIPGSTENVEVVANIVKDLGRSGLRERNIYLYLPEEEFSSENLIAIFDKFGSDFCSPYSLHILIFTSRDSLKRRIEVDSSDLFVDFENSEKGRQAAHQYYGKASPLLNSFLFAEYFRNGDYELFDYSPEKGNPSTVRISMKSDARLTSGTAHQSTSRKLCSLP